MSEDPQMKHDRPAPIALFAFNRPDHTEKTLRALAENELASASDLTVFCDGPRTPDERELTEQVREIARAAEGFGSVRVVTRDENLGVARSVIAGVSEIMANHDSIIVLEDDLLTSPYFLQYMNDGLRTYAEDDRVLSISGYRFPVEGTMPETFFVPGAFCWGWATWRRGWDLYEHDAEKALNEIVERDLIYKFDFQGSDPLTLILQATVLQDARADSWATRWMATACIHGKVSLYPFRSLIANIGFDGSGRHANHDDSFETPMAERRPRVGTNNVEIDPSVIDAHRELFVRWRTGRNWKKRLYYRITSILPQALEKRIYTALVHRWMERSRNAGRSVLKA